MPELPEVETVRRGLEPALLGRRLARVVARRPDLRAPLPDAFAARLEGRRVSRVARRAKYLLIHTEAAGPVLIAHLGMSGRMAVLTPPVPPAGRHDHVDLVTDEGVVARFTDPRRFGLMTLAEPGALDQHPLLRRLGPEPLDPAFDGAALAARLAGRRTSIKAALLDQTVVAGLGNIYVCEALFRAGISPFCEAACVRGRRAARLAAAVHAVLEEALAAGGSTLRDHRLTTGELGYFQHRFAVYGREGRPCPGCDCAAGAVRRAVQAGRSTFYCAHRQR